MTTRRVAACCGVGLPLGYAEANSKQGPREAGMCASASAAGHRHTAGIPGGKEKEVASS